MYYRDENNEWQELILEPSGDTLPIGTIAQFGGSTAPTNWLICNGQAISRTTYSELFSIIGTTYGDGNGTTTFNLPDFSSRSPIGIGTGTDDNDVTETTTLGQSKGEYEHTLIENEIPKHVHKVYEFNTNNAGSWTYGGIAVLQGAAQGQGASRQNTSETGNDEAHNNIQPVLGVNFIIKAKQSIGVVGTVTDDITDVNNDAVPTASTVKGYVDKAVAMYGVDNTSLSFTNTSGYQSWQIPLNEKKSSFNDTNKFIFDATAHTVTIGAGVSKIKVSAKLAISRGDGNYLNIYVLKNGTAVCQSSCYFADWCASAPVIPCDLIDVQQGDVITMEVGIGAGATGKTFQFSYPNRIITLTLEQIK